MVSPTAFLADPDASIRGQGVGLTVLVETPARPPVNADRPRPTLEPGIKRATPQVAEGFRNLRLPFRPRHPWHHI
jgi:hypothetical protein